MLVDLMRCLEVWDALKWRHHSTGLLQAYVPKYDGAMRVHIWNKRLKLRDSGEMHNHRFTLQSHVLVGSLTHERLVLTPDEAGGSHNVWEIPGASQGSDAELRLHERKSDKGSRVNVERTDKCQFMSGDSYTVRKWDFHHARQEDDDAELTVTVVRLLNKETTAPAALLYPVGHRPRHAFTDKPEPALMTSLIQDSRLHLRKTLDAHS